MTDVPTPTFNRIEDMLALLRDQQPEPGETGVQRISWAFGQVAMSHVSSGGVITPEAERKLREQAEQAVCASYEEKIARLESRARRFRGWRVLVDHNGKTFRGRVKSLSGARLDARTRRESPLWSNIRIVRVFKKEKVK